MEKAKSKKKIVIIVIAVLVVAACAVAAFLLLGNRDPEVKAGQNVVVTVMADKLEDMYGYQFQMNYDPGQLEYTGSSPTSKIDDIQWVFSTAFDGYELVGGTMTGDKAGISGSNKALCELVFTAKQDGKLSDFTLSISEINTVKAPEGASIEDMEYVEGIQGWSIKSAVRDADPSDAADGSNAGDAGAAA